jgi:hypothetical protein
MSRHFFLLLFFFPLFNSCKSRIQEEIVVRPTLDIRLSDQELDSLKSFIIEQYWKYDSVYFSPSDNCYFRQFVENELEMFGYYYDTLYEGISIKHYIFPYTNFRFNLIRGSDGTFYYLGLSDWQYIVESIVNAEYTEISTFNYQLNSGSERTFLDLHASTEGAFNRIFQRDTLFHFNGTANSYQAMSRAEGFVFHNYKWRKDGTGYPFIPIFSKHIAPGALKGLMEKYKGGELSENELRIEESYKRLIFYYMDERADLYEIDQVGILSFHFRKGISKISLDQSIFPTKNRPYISLNPAIDSLIDWNLYEECRDKH